MSNLKMVLERIVPRIPKPKPRLEQYRTPPEIAVEVATLTLRARPRLVVDLGCGTGSLAAAVALVAGAEVVCVEIDAELLELIRSSELWQIPGINVVAADALSPPVRSCDVVVTNPPFGVRSRRGMDFAFIESAASLRPRLIVAIVRWVERSLELLAERMRRLSYECLVAARRRFPLPAFLEVHRRRLHYIDVALVVCTRVEGIE